MGDHYVPKFYLKGFLETPNSDQIWVYDKGESKVFKTNIKNIAQETGFYSSDTENYLANEIENPANPVIQKIREGQAISIDEKKILSRYMFVMWKRVPKHKWWVEEKAPEAVNSIMSRIEQQLKNIKEQDPTKGDLVEKRRSELKTIGENKITELIQDYWLTNISTDITLPLVEILGSMTWRFLISDCGFFVTSDNPLFFFHWLGIGNQKSEVSFPISNNIALWATRRSDLKNGQFVKVNKQIVKELNRRTISNSARFVFSCSPAEWISNLINKDNLHLNRIT